MTAEPATVPADHGKAGEPSRLTPRLRAILAIVIVASMLDLMDSQITNIAAPSIARELGGGESLIKWLGASYQLAIGTFLRPGHDHRRPVQGSFGALLIPQGISIIITSFSREQLPRATSAFGPALGLSAVLGPIVGGFIISANLAGLGWRPVFLINIVLGTAGLIAAFFVLPHDQPVSDERIDGLGSGLLGLTMLSLFFGLIQGSTDGWTAVPVAWPPEPCCSRPSPSVSGTRPARSSSRRCWRTRGSPPG